MGSEALKPFLEREDKGIIVLAKTSNPGAGEFQDDYTTPLERLTTNREEMVKLLDITGKTDIPLYLGIAHRVSRHWNRNGNCALVVGATYPSELEKVRKIVLDMPILIPGVGEQGGDLQKNSCCRHGRGNFRNDY